MKITLKNMSVKVINIGKSILLPGDEMEVTEEIAKLPAVVAIARKGLLTIERDDSDERAAAEEAAKAKAEAEAEARARAEAEAKAKAEVEAKAAAKAKAKEQK